MLDKVHMQFQFFMDDPTYRDHHAMQVELVRTLARIGPNTEPKFRDECELNTYFVHYRWQFCLLVTWFDGICL